VTTFKVLLGAAALWPALFLLASQRDAPPPPSAPDTLAGRWPAEEPVAPKANRLPIAEPAPAAAVEPPVPVAAARTDVHQTVGATVSARRHTEHHGDICTRHGMHKVETHGGRSWRCRR